MGVRLNVGDYNPLTLCTKYASDIPWRPTYTGLLGIQPGYYANKESTGLPNCCVYVNIKGEIAEMIEMCKCQKCYYFSSYIFRLSIL